MLVLQDFEALTPNLLARTVETVEGGGIVVLLLRTMSSLQQLYTMTMVSSITSLTHLLITLEGLSSSFLLSLFPQDVHARYRTDSHASVVPRFNERFILSLGSCDDCLILDDELNVLPISTGKDIVPVAPGKAKAIEGGKELKGLKESLEDTKPVGELVKLAKTLDQVSSHLVRVATVHLWDLGLAKGEAATRASQTDASSSSFSLFSPPG